MAKQKTINLWFFPIKQNKCPHCKAQTQGLVYGWYEYIRSKKRLIAHFCFNCFEVQVVQVLDASPYAKGKLRSVQGQNLPDYIIQRLETAGGPIPATPIAVYYGIVDKSRHNPHECTVCGMYTYHSTDCQYTGLVSEGQ